MPLSGDYAEIRTGGVGRHALRIASEPPPLPPLLPLLLELLLRPPPPPPLPPPPPALLELLGELAEGAAGAEDPGEALCNAEYLGSTCRLPPCGMLNACLLFRDIIIIFPACPRACMWLTQLAPVAGTLRRSAGREPERGRAMRSCAHSPPLGARRALTRLRAPPLATRSVCAVAGLRLALAVDLGMRNCPALRGRRVILPSPRACPLTPASLPPSLPRAPALPCLKAQVSPARILASPLLPLGFLQALVLSALPTPASRSPAAPSTSPSCPRGALMSPPLPCAPQLSLTVVPLLKPTPPPPSRSALQSQGTSYLRAGLLPRLLLPLPSPPRGEKKLLNKVGDQGSLGWDFP